jgi:hypothetical protein
LPDGVIAGALALLATAASYTNSGLFPPQIVDAQAADVLFSADIPRVYANMTDRASNHYRTAVHPLFPLLTYPPVRLLRGAGLEAITAVRVLIAVTAGLWAALVFALLRYIGCRRLDAVAFTGLGLSSAATSFWFAVPETYGLGALTVLLVLLFAGYAERRRPASAPLVGLNVVALSVTLTNWMAAIFVTLALRLWRESLRIAAVAFAIVLVLTGVERLFFAHVRPPLYLLREDLTVYTRRPSVADAGRVMLSFMVDPMVLPSIRFVDNPRHPEWPKMRVAFAGWGGRFGVLAAAMWGALLVLGAIGFARMREHRLLRLVAAGTLAGQLALHLVYGNETFLYALHWVALLVVIAATATLTRARLLALLLCIAIALTAGYDNAAQLRRAAGYFGASEAERQALAAAEISP